MSDTEKNVETEINADNVTVDQTSSDSGEQNTEASSGDEGSSDSE